MPDRTGPLDEYARAISANLCRGDTTELTHRSALQTLLEAACPGLVATHEPRRIACGAPDFIVSRGPVTIGYVEAKDVGENLTKIERTDQLQRYRDSLPNLILTDYVEFRWYADGEWRETARLGMVDRDGVVNTTRNGLGEVSALLEKFLLHKSPSATTARQLAVQMARYARMIRDITAATLAQGGEPGTLHGQYQAFRQTLLPELTAPEFADMFAQTIAYGLFAARERAASGTDFTRKSAGWLLPRSNPFLRSLFGQVAGLDLDDRVAWILDDLAQVLAYAQMDAIIEDFLARVRREDPVVHFYETFLAEYDPKVREMRGVYYTPEPVVSYIVRSVDHLLRTKFDCPQGLADPSVLILDPACGTGTFLFGVVKLIHQQMVEQGQAGGWNDYVTKHLLPRLFGFELLMAPYAIAHLKLGLLLEETGYEFKSNERLGIYLTNTLQDAVTARALPFMEFITEEANAAAEIKRDRPIMVVLGNPPYSGHSANKGKWIDGLLKGRLRDGTKVPSYYEVDGKALGEKNPKMLQDDYVKFIRFAQWRIERTGQGMLAFINNHGYLDNPTFRGMRQRLMNAFTDIYLLDLHGNKRKKERSPDGSPDDNVFDIQQGTAIGIFVKERGKGEPAAVHHADLWGSRAGKCAVLEESAVHTTTWKELVPRPPFQLLLPQDAYSEAEYETWWKLNDAMPVCSTGVKTHRDELVYDFNENALRNRIDDFLNPANSDDAIRQRYFHNNAGASREAGDTGTWSLAEGRKAIRKDPEWRTAFVRCLYRPFDVRWLFYHGAAVDRSRHDVMRHVLKPHNLGIVFMRQVALDEPYSHFLVSRLPVDNRAFYSSRGIMILAPLYLCPDPKTNGDLFSNGSVRHVNFNPEFVADIEKRLGMTFISDGKGDLTATFGPEDVFDYIYAVLHSPTYRTRYAEFLKLDFPRVPLTSDRDVFMSLVRKGTELVALHLMESPALHKLITGYPATGSHVVEKVRYDEANRRVWINKLQYFEGVEPGVWAFHVGGYQVLEKWLKDRKGRKLTWEDQQHYQRVVVALKETARLMREIDQAIPSWPIG